MCYTFGAFRAYNKMMMMMMMMMMMTMMLKRKKKKRKMVRMISAGETGAKRSQDALI